MVALERERAALDAEASAMQQAATQARGYGDAIEYARTRAQLLAAAQAEGRAITPELSAEKLRHGGLERRTGGEET